MDIDRLISICRTTGPTGPTGATGTASFNTYMMAICTAGQTYTTDAPMLFNTTTPFSNITYNAGTFTLSQAGIYLIK